MKWITRVFWLWFLIGFILMVFWEVPDALEFSKSLFLLFFAIYAFALLRDSWNLSHLQSLWILIPVGFLSLWIEAIGTATGWPFGHYTYGNDIGFKLLDVPITISFAWIAIVTTVIMFSTSRPRWLRAFEVGIWAMCFDLVLDPAAVVQGWWNWHHTLAEGGEQSIFQVLWSSAAFYGIPFSNFVSWFLVAYLLSFFYPTFVTTRKTRRRALRLYQLMIVMFAALCAKGGLVWPVLIALMVIVASEWRERHDQSRTTKLV
jgi:uncharacterized membrane protein